MASKTDFLQTSIAYYAQTGGKVASRETFPVQISGGSTSSATPPAPKPAPEKAAPEKAAPKKAGAGAGKLERAQAESKGTAKIAVNTEPAPDPAVNGNKFLAQQKEMLDMCKRRFFYRPAFEIYGGVAGFFTYGPPGCALKNNLIQAWRNHFVIEENLLEIEDTCIMQHQVLKASGHVERFNDFMVKDTKDEAQFFRADKLLEEVMEAKIDDSASTPAQKAEYTIVKNQADGFSREEMHALFQKYDIKSPTTGNDLSEPYEFNLMFPTPIGPGGYLQGYLRPETAQGIFLNFKFCLEQNSNRLPFGVAQVGRAFRNEIAPRAHLTRQREFTQAEIEYFVNPNKKDHPKFASVADLKLTLFPQHQQLNALDPVRMTIGDAVKQGIVNNETLGYMVARTYQFLRNSGVVDECLRFRQHLSTEMAHYACDCWDAECFVSYGWLECVGVADRSAFDLTAHAAASKTDLDYKEKLDTPITSEVIMMTKQGEVAVMKAMKKDGKLVKQHLGAFTQAQWQEVSGAKESGAPEFKVEIDGKEFSVPMEAIVLETKTQQIHTKVFTPGVIEPSFGIDRIFTAMLEHAYHVRPAEEGESETRHVLRLAASVAPYKCTLLPMDQRIGRDDKYDEMKDKFRGELAQQGLSYTLDESGATLGKRYARNDELGIPFAVTFDFDTLKDRTVTVRERDSMKQIRLPLDAVPSLIQELCSTDSAAMKWTDAVAKYPFESK